jgi:hypothetical protein
LIVGISSSVLTAGVILAALTLSRGPAPGSGATAPNAYPRAAALPDAGDAGKANEGGASTNDAPGLRLRLVVNNRPLREVAGEVQRLSGIRIVVSDAVPDVPTTVRFEDDPVEAALKRLVAGYDSYFLYSPQPVQSGSDKGDLRLSAVLVYPQGHGQLADPGSDLLVALLNSGLIANPDDLAAAGRERPLETITAQPVPLSAETLQAALKDSDESVRIEALHAMLQQAPAALPDQTLRDIARHDASATVRSMALAGLVNRAEAGSVDPAEIRETLTLARADPDPGVAELATQLSANLTAITEPDVSEAQGAEPDPQLQGAGEPRAN